MPLPQFGIHTNVRVCSDCFNVFSRSKGDGSGATVDTVNFTAESVSRLDINGDLEHETEPSPPPVSTNLECKCGMPLCICETSLPSTEAAPAQTVFTSSAASNSRPKKMDAIPRQRRSGQDSRQGSSVSLGPSASESDKPKADYEVNGEGLREAIKNGDIAAVKDLLDKGVDSNYCDKQGFSLLHLAAVFNQTDITFALMDYGAKLDCKNSQGETPLDCAPVTLQYKMKNKMEEGLH